MTSDVVILSFPQSCLISGAEKGHNSQDVKALRFLKVKAGGSLGHGHSQVI